jgi:hypothetical protein
MTDGFHLIIDALAQRHQHHLRARIPITDSWPQAAASRHLFW